jgi:hypothetical protein
MAAGQHPNIVPIHEGPARRPAHRRDYVAGPSLATARWPYAPGRNCWPPLPRPFIPIGKIFTATEAVPHHPGRNDQPCDRLWVAKELIPRWARAVRRTISLPWCGVSNGPWRAGAGVAGLHAAGAGRRADGAGRWSDVYRSGPLTTCTGVPPFKADRDRHLHRGCTTRVVPPHRLKASCR